MIWTRPKRIQPVQNDWYSTKIIWTVQNHFGPIEGQGISVHALEEPHMTQLTQIALRHHKPK